MDVGAGAHQQRAVGLEREEVSAVRAPRADQPAGGDEPSRTELKRESDELQKLGVDLLTLRADLLARLELSDKQQQLAVHKKSNRNNCNV